MEHFAEKYNYIAGSLCCSASPISGVGNFFSRRAKFIEKSSSRARIKAKITNIQK